MLHTFFGGLSILYPFDLLADPHSLYPLKLISKLTTHRDIKYSHCGMQILHSIRNT